MDKFFITIANFPIGKLTLCSNKTALVGIWFEKQKYFGANLLKDTIQNDSLEIVYLLRFDLLSNIQND